MDLIRICLNISLAIILLSLAFKLVDPKTTPRDYRAIGIGFGVLFLIGYILLWISDPMDASVATLWAGVFIAGLAWAFHGEADTEKKKSENRED